MTPYFVLLAFLLVLGLVMRERCMTIGRNGMTGYLVVACSAMALLAALRAPTVGADTQQYVEIFNWVKTLPISNIGELNRFVWWDSAGNIEITYKVYNKIVSLLCDDQQAITVANSLVLMAAFFRMVKRESKDYWLSALLFFCLGFYQLSLNLTPSSIAALIMFGSVSYVREQKIIPWLASTLVACIFHTSAIMLFPLYWLFQLRINKRRFFTLILIGCALGLIAYRPVASILAALVPGSYVGYLSSTKVKPEQVLVLTALIALVLMAILSKKESLFKSENRIHLWVVVLICISYAFSINNTYITRFAFLLSPYLVVTIPNLLYDGGYLKRIDLSANKTLAMRSSESWAFLIVVFAVALYLARSSVNNIGTTVPYLFFFSV